MENISGDMDKAVARPDPAKPRRPSPGWTLLCVGDHGKVIRVPRFKGLLIIWMVFSLIFLTAAVCLAYFYYDQSIQNKALEDALKSSRQKMKALRDEKDILLTRVVLAESNREQAPAAPSAGVEKTPAAEAAVREPESDGPLRSPSARPEADILPAVAAVVEIDDDPETEPETRRPLEISESPVTAEPGAVIAVDDFFAIVEPDGNRLRVNYKVRNIDPNANPISGRTFLILKTKNEGAEDWMILPEVPLASGKPIHVKNGKSFSITRFKTIRFKARYPDGRNPYAAATVLVYTTTGELLLEKNFSIENDRIEPATAG